MKRALGLMGFIAAITLPPGETPVKASSLAGHREVAYSKAKIVYSFLDLPVTRSLLAHSEISSIRQIVKSAL